MNMLHQSYISAMYTSSEQLMDSLTQLNNVHDTKPMRQNKLVDVHDSWMNNEGVCGEGSF
jgi:hypothetical protein